MGMRRTGRGLDGTAQVNDLALHPAAMRRDVSLHIVYLDVHVCPAAVVEHVNALQTPFEDEAPINRHASQLTVANIMQCTHQVGLPVVCLVTQYKHVA